MENPQEVSGSTATNPMTATTVTWDPLQHLENRNPTKGCLKRIRNDLKSLFKEPIPGIYAVPDDVNATVVHALLVGAFETPYEGGFFYFIVNFPDNYPSEPPKVKVQFVFAIRAQLRKSKLLNIVLANDDWWWKCSNESKL